MKVENIQIDWNGLKRHMKGARDQIRVHETAELGRTNIAMIKGTAHFIDRCTLEIVSNDGMRRISARKFVLATGAAARIPDLDGLAESGFVTHEQIFDLDSLPGSLLILGGGPIACELAHAFQRLGSRVTIVQRGPRLLPHEDEEIARKCQQILERDGVQIYVGAKPLRAGNDAGGKFVEFEVGPSHQVAHGDQLLVAVGKQHDFSSLKLEAVGVRTSSRGLLVDKYLRTTAPNIWACGDAIGGYMFTHVAEYEAKLAAQNALLPVSVKANYRVVPWAVFTDPEIAHVGLTEAEAKQRYSSCKVFKVPFSQVDRAIMAREHEGFAKIITTSRGRILGVHIIGPSAGELIHSFLPALRDGTRLKDFADTIHVYPTLADIGHRAGTEYYRDMLKSKWVQWALTLLARLMGWGKRSAG